MELSNVCRCCLAEGCYKELSTEYFYGGQSEIYTKMLQDTFSLTLTDHEELKQLICNNCIGKLRQADSFKKMVMETEDTLMKMLGLKNSDSQDLVTPLKLESDYIDDFDDRIDGHYNEDFVWDGNDVNGEAKGHLYVIKLEPKGELDHEPTAKVKEKSSSRKKTDGKVKKSKMSTKKVKLGKKTAIKKTNEIISETQTTRRENSLKLILNSNLCLFKSLKTKFGCFHCKESFMTMPELREHTKTHSNTRILRLRINCLRGMSYRNVDISSLACKLCETRLNNLSDLSTHLSVKHKIQLGDDHFLIPYNLENGFKCVICESTFNTYTRLAIHMNSHYTNNVCEICGVSYINRLSLRMHTNAVHKEKKCSVCSATFLSHYLRVKHMKKVHNTGQYKRYCLLCDKTFRYSYLLQEHRIQEHGVKRQISSCTECDKTFLSPQNLKIHIRSVHVKERNFPCATCGMRFFTKCDQKRHERTHEDVRSFACGYCEGRFKAKDSWRRHLRRQHAHVFDSQ